VIVYVLPAGGRAPRLAWTGGIVLGFGMCGLMAAQGDEALQFALATGGRFDLAALADVVDSTGTAAEIALGVVFPVGAAIGILITAAALWRSRAVPRAVPILMLAFIVTGVPLSQPLIAHVTALVGASWVAWPILTVPSATAEAGAV
jgi:hypothetical protein